MTAIKDIKESENIASLHNQIASCDTILAVSWYFQYDIYQVSHQIQFQLIPGTFSTSVDRRKMHKVKTFCHLYIYILIFCTFLLTLSFLVWSWWFQGTLVYSTLFISMTKSLVSKVFSLHPLIYCNSFQHLFKRKTTQTMPSLSL